MRPMMEPTAAARWRPLNPRRPSNGNQLHLLDGPQSDLFDSDVVLNRKPSAGVDTDWTFEDALRRCSSQSPIAVGRPLGVLGPGGKSSSMRRRQEVLSAVY